ncbi:MAG: MFS transporter [Pseudomonadota bacterium]
MSDQTAPAPSASSVAAGSPPGVSLSALAGYAAPQFALAALYFPVITFLVPYYDTELGLPLLALGAVMVAIRLLDAVTDPLMGAVSDATRSRFGRRKIWLIIATPLVCLSVWMAFTPPDDAGLGYFAIWVTALSLSWTVAITPYFAWGGEIASDYRGRARVAGWRETTTLLGTLAAAVVYGSAPDDPATGLERLAWTVLIALPLGVALAVWLAPSPPQRGRSAPPLSLAAWRAAWSEMMANEAFRRFMASHIANSAANGLPPVLILYFITVVLQGTTQDFVLSFLIYLACAIIGAPIWSQLAQRGAKHRVWGAAMLYAMAVFAAVPLLGAGDVTAFLVISGLTGLAYGADVVLPPAIQADVVDADTAVSGADRTGVYFALLSVVLKGASGLAAGAALVALGAAGFEADGENGALALNTLVALYAVIPILLKGLAVWLIWNFPIDAAAQAELKARIDAALL